jgi:hypothetical protein
MASLELPDLSEFDERFRRKYGRYLTAEERKFFLLAEHLLKHPPEPCAPKPKLTRILSFAPVSG